MKIFSLLSLFLILCLYNSAELFCQDVYKTPTGEKYHLSSCRMVKNVSTKLVGADEISKYSLEPCKICNPPVQKSIVKSYTGANKAVGESESQQCKGKTATGTRCQHMTRIANGYCYQHTGQYKN